MGCQYTSGRNFEPIRIEEEFTMSIKERILTIKLIEKIKKYPKYAEKIKVSVKEKRTGDSSVSGAK